MLNACPFVGRSRRIALLASTCGLALAAPALAVVDPLEAYLNSIRLNELYAATTLRGSGINIGQVEPGTPNASHTVLAGATVTINPVAEAVDHATGVASLMVGQRTLASGNFQGVAPSASLWSSTSGAGGTSTVTTLNSSMNWELTAPVASVVNHSWGRNWDRTPAIRPVFARLIDNASSLGQTQVVAAGNEGTEAGDGGNTTGNLSWPGYSYNALTVGALGPAGTWNRIADFSSVTQADAMGNPTARLKVEIVAPGVGIRQASGTGAGSSTMASPDGTSFATPITAGVVALLQEHGGIKGYSTDPRLMRAVIMNSADKTVQNRAGTRWDAEFVADASGVAATRASNQTGAGKLDAMEAYTQYNAGRGMPTLIATSGGTGADVKAVGWDVNTATGKGLSNSNDYRTAPLRKGSYLTSTLTWNRGVNAADADPNNWTDEAPAGMNLSVSRLGSINTLLSTSNFGEMAGGGENDALKGTSQHNVYKIQNRDSYYVRAINRDTSPLNSVDYAVAWRGYDAPNDHKVFNGDFSGDRGAYRDNGWYKTADSITSPTVVREPWMPGTDDNWAMRSTIAANSATFSGFSQEVLAPYGFFHLDFDLAFGTSTTDSWLQVFLGGVNVTQSLGGIIGAGGSAQNFVRWSLDLDANQLAGMTVANGFVDLSFSFRSTVGNMGYVDNVYYVPAGSSVSIVALAGLVAVRRRRRAG